MTAEVGRPKYNNIFEALSAAQAEMGRVVKDSLNPHFNRKYADLAAVLEAVMPALNNHGICLWQYIKDGRDTSLMVTVLSYSDAAGAITQISCEVPLIVSKNDMQGFKSATTYAKRIGVESVCGVAPEDDDGNEAAKNPPPPSQRPPQQPEKYTGTDVQRKILRNIFSIEGVESEEVMIKIAEKCQGKLMTDIRDFVKREVHGGR